MKFRNKGGINPTLGSVPFNTNNFTVLFKAPMSLLILLILSINLALIVKPQSNLLLQSSNQISTTNDGVTADKYVSYI